MAHTEDADISSDVKRQILKSEIDAYRNTIYQLQVRYRVNDKLKNKSAMAECEKSLADCEMALDLLLEMSKEVDAPTGVS